MLSSSSCKYFRCLDICIGVLSVYYLLCCFITVNSCLFSRLFISNKSRVCRAFALLFVHIPHSVHGYCSAGHIQGSYVIVCDVCVFYITQYTVYEAKDSNILAHSCYILIMPNQCMPSIHLNRQEPAETLVKQVFQQNKDSNRIP